jgi:hypothetical protein
LSIKEVLRGKFIEESEDAIDKLKRYEDNTQNSCEIQAPFIFLGEKLYKVTNTEDKVCVLIEREDCDFFGRLLQPKGRYYTIALALNMEGDYDEYAFKWVPIDELLAKKESTSFINRIGI